MKTLVKGVVKHDGVSNVAKKGGVLYGKADYD